MYYSSQKSLLFCFCVLVGGKDETDWKSRDWLFLWSLVDQSKNLFFFFSEAHLFDLLASIPVACISAIIISKLSFSDCCHCFFLSLFAPFPFPPPNLFGLVDLLSPSHRHRSRYNCVKHWTSACTSIVASCWSLLGHCQNPEIHHANNYSVLQQYQDILGEKDALAFQSEVACKLNDTE